MLLLPDRFQFSREGKVTKLEIAWVSEPKPKKAGPPSKIDWNQVVKLCLNVAAILLILLKQLD
jgi:hypothetical protein